MNGYAFVLDDFGMFFGLEDGIILQENNQCLLKYFCKRNNFYNHEEHEGHEDDSGYKEKGICIMEFSELSNRVIGCAIEVHKLLGPGLLESTYRQCLAHELALNNIGF